MVLPLCLDDPRAIEIVEQIPNQKRSKIIEKYVILGSSVSVDIDDIIVNDT